jgi:hypothetical protein
MESGGNFRPASDWCVVFLSSIAICRRRRASPGANYLGWQNIVEPFEFDHTRVDPPVADAFEPGEALFCSFERILGRLGRPDHDCTLTGPEQAAVSGKFIHKADTVAWHRNLPAQRGLSLVLGLSPLQLCSGRISFSPRRLFSLGDIASCAPWPDAATIHRFDG